MDTQRLVTYGSVIKLRDRPTGKFLRALESSYVDTTQRKVIAATGEGDTNEWRVMPPNGDSAQPSGKTVMNGDVFRLLHVKTGRFLHSHPHVDSRPFSGVQQVTAYPEVGGQSGDVNDNWQLYTSGAGAWILGEPVGFIHENTSKDAAKPKKFLYTGTDIVHSDYWEGNQGIVCRDASALPGIDIWTTFHPADASTATVPGVRMQLKEVRIRAFRSIRSEVRLLVDEKVTVLVGANDHGKSNILKAVQRLNDDGSFTGEDVNWDSDGPAAPQIEWDFDVKFEAEHGAAPTQPVQSDGSPNSELRFPTKVTFIRRGVDTPVIVENSGNVPLDPRLAAALLGSRPRVELFEPPKAMYDEVSEEQLEAPSHEFMKGLFIKAGLWPERKRVFNQESVAAKLIDDASKRLTTILREEWEQGKDLEWKFEHVNSGKSIRLRIRDPAVTGRFVDPSQRSSGFTAFFVHSLTTYARTALLAAQSFLFLFDEPGTYLHPIAQVNLQRVFENLARAHQIIYSTHSVFLVNKNFPQRNRVIRKILSGTSVDLKPFRNNWKVMRESLGILMSHNFMIADRTLLTEGPSDVIYLAALLGKLVNTGKVDVDLNDFSIVDGGDETNYVAMCKLMLDEGRKVLALLDGDGHGRKLEGKLKKVAERHLQEGDLKIQLLPNGCSIEDLLIEPRLYREAVCETMEKVVENGLDSYAPKEPEAEIMNKLDMDLQAKPEITLGKHAENLTKKIYASGDSVSKLNVSLVYEDKLQSLLFDETWQLAEPLENLLGRIREGLTLQTRARKPETMPVSTS